ncbi:hypothetical protein DVH24_038631 [Malus domestica]|uniref:Uncharacterized protein n=1 Tax=Malus domestica TaxID=3750 RepID=A0A498KAJ4_MALDO|nr:hypothetical protein DVH24_038631 [Malus domestica]
MAATSASFTPRLVGSTVNPRTAGAPFSVRISSGGNYPTTRDTLAEGPYCIYVGPIETASKETLEALYSQARDAYYSGDPLIVDDMFDRVEFWFLLLTNFAIDWKEQLKLRWYGSKCVMKYPRCSLRRQSTYADAEEDLSQVFALASIWILLLAFGTSACLVPIVYSVGIAYKDAFDPGFSYINQASALSMLNSVLFMTLGCVIVSAYIKVTFLTVKVLKGLWRNDLVALKGVCPNCGDEVFAFVQSDQSNNSPHRANCHVCECLLEFRTKVEKSVSPLGRRWVYGRIYLVSRRGRSQFQRRL